MAEKWKEATSGTSAHDRSDDPTRTSDITMRGNFESLLDETSSNEDESSILETTTDNRFHKNMKTRASIDERNQQRSIIEDDSDEVILSMIWIKGHLGGAYYNVVTSELFVMNDVMDDTNYGITKALYKQSQPRVVVTTTGMSEAFVNVVKKLIIKETMSEENDEASSVSASSSGRGVPVGASLALMPKQQYAYEHCYHRVLCLKLNCEPDNASNAERRIFLNSLLNFTCRLMIHSLGLLLKYIDINWNKLTLNATGSAAFLHICYVMLENLVMIDDDTYKILDIVRTRFHPSLFKFGKFATNDHGVSLFSLLNRCQSRPGVCHLWKLLRHPTKDVNLLKKRFDAVQFFSDPDNRSVVETLKNFLARVYRPPKSVVNQFSAPDAKPADWNRFQKTLSNVICIGEICTERRNSLSIFARIADGVTSDMHVVRYFIDYIVDFESSRIQEKLIIKAGVDPELDELNNIRQKLPQLLSEMAEKDMKKYSLVMERCRMIYVPDIRYVLAITEGATTDAEAAMPGLEFKFSINGVRHYKSDGARELDETIGDVLLKITKRQSQIILRLVRFMSKHTGSILKSIELCAELDTLISFATVARDQNYVMPELVESRTLSIKGARHPLKELLVNFVPNDIYSGGDCSLVKILTGPNACGKSIYLKQIALIVFMAHIGSFVPAESAIIGTVSHIFTQMNSMDSLAQNASSFLLGLRQINLALYGSTPNSLVIIDEFGAGTTEIDGLALLTAVLQSFVERGILCPHIFAATHIHRVVELLPKIPMIEAQTFEFLSNDANELVFLYRLINGNASASFAHSVARSAGLDESVVNRALEVFEAKKRGTLPAPLPNVNPENTMMHIMELLSDPSGKINLEDLELWVRQATAKPPRK